MCVQVRLLGGYGQMIAGIVVQDADEYLIHYKQAIHELLQTGA